MSETVDSAKQSNAEWLDDYEASAVEPAGDECQPETAKYALKTWLRADCTDEAVISHPYARAKGVNSAGGAGRALVSGRIIGKDADCIVIPIRNLKTGKVVAVQCVNAAGRKQSFGRVSGNGLLLGNTLDKSIGWFVSEGWASAYSMVFHHAGGNACCAAAFGKGNLEKVAETIAEIYAPDAIVIIREQDE